MCGNASVVAFVRQFPIWLRYAIRALRCALYALSRKVLKSARREFSVCRGPHARRALVNSSSCHRLAMESCVARNFTRPRLAMALIESKVSSGSHRASRSSAVDPLESLNQFPCGARRVRELRTDPLPVMPGARDRWVLNVELTRVCLSQGAAALLLNAGVSLRTEPR